MLNVICYSPVIKRYWISNDIDVIIENEVTVYFDEYNIMIGTINGLIMGYDLSWCDINSCFSLGSDLIYEYTNYLADVKSNIENIESDLVACDKEQREYEESLYSEDIECEYWYKKLEVC